MTKIGERQEKVGSQLFGRCSQISRALLAASLCLSGCSLAVPEENELFRPDGVDSSVASDSGADSLDSSGESMDSAVLDATGPDADAGTDSAAPGDAGTLPDGAADAGSIPFDPAAGLVLHYRFNESSGNTVNDFAGEKDAIIVGTPSGHEQWVAAGRIDGALKLAGGTAPDGGTGHYVELPQGTLLGLSECTIALWVNRAGGPLWQRVFDFGSGMPNWFYFSPVGATGLPVVAGRVPDPGPIFVDFQNIPTAPAGQGALKINKAIPVSTWVHFAVTWSGNEIKAYLDGALVAQTVTNGGITPSDLGNTSQNYLGRSQFAPDPYFNGMIDDLRIYNRILTASDVAALYNVR